MLDYAKTSDLELNSMIDALQRINPLTPTQSTILQSMLKEREGRAEYEAVGREIHGTTEVADAIDWISKTNVLSPEDEDLIMEAQHYTKVKWAKIDKNYLNYLKRFFEFAPTDIETTWAFYHRGKEGHCDIVHETERGATIVIWVENDKPFDPNAHLWNCLQNSHWSFCREGLIKLLNPNYGGYWSEQTKDLAGVIIYG